MGWKGPYSLSVGDLTLEAITRVGTTKRERLEKNGEREKRKKSRIEIQGGGINSPLFLQNGRSPLKDPCSAHVCKIRLFNNYLFDGRRRTRTATSSSDWRNNTSSLFQHRVFAKTNNLPLDNQNVFQGLRSQSTA